jgi:hypothetical protein
MFVYSTVALMGPNEDLEIRRRSLAMLTPGARSDLSREEAISLIEEVQGARKRIVELEREIREATTRHPAAGHRDA